MSFVCFACGSWFHKFTINNCYEVESVVYPLRGVKNISPEEKKAKLVVCGCFQCLGGRVL